jgi:hypothetical protein
VPKISAAVDVTVRLGAMTAAPVDARRVTVTAVRIGRWVDGFVERHGPVVAVAADRTVWVTGADGARAWLDAPWLPDWRTGSPGAGPGTGDPAQGPLEAFLAHVRRQRRIGVVLARRGGHGVGIFDGTTLVASKVGSSYVQGTTKAGGWSQHRYARRRTNQAAAAFATAADAAARILLPQAATLAALVRGGDRAAVQAVLADPRLAPLAELHSGPLLAVADPRLRVLQASAEQFLAVSVRLSP